ncbi:UNVERIFIED_CONTAM: Ubiquinone biosynthesis protein COQ9, mitochondrial [Sesamum latifolium]|uniref:Ubiquinone biosynthesis protein n=1 Tax=Sesamum latifolium TaxID=2727402 RepID=A0AAW2TZ20_9LAMI
MFMLHVYEVSNKPYCIIVRFLRNVSIGGKTAATGVVAAQLHSPGQPSPVLSHCSAPIIHSAAFSTSAASEKALNHKPHQFHSFSSSSSSDGGNLEPRLAGRKNRRACSSGLPQPPDGYWKASIGREALSLLLLVFCGSNVIAIRTCDKLVRINFEMQAPYISKWPQALSIQAQPSNISTSFKQRAMLVDEIWHAAGDEATDIDWYVKRTV